MNKYFNLELINSCLLVSFPIFLISGPFVPDLIASYFALYFVIFIIFIKKKYSLISNNFFYFLFFIYLYLVFNSLFSFDIKISLSKSLPFIRVIFFIFFISFILQKYKKIYTNFYIIFCICLVFLLIDSLLQFFLSINIIGNEVKMGSRISSFFGDKLVMGSYVSRMLPLIIAIAFINNFKNKNKLNIILIIISYILVLLSGERVAFIYFTVTLIFYFIIFRSYFFKFLIIGSIIFLTIFLYNPSNITRIFPYTFQQINQSTYNLPLSYRHELHLKTAYEMFLNHKLLGNGLKSFRYLCSDKKISSIIEEKISLDYKKYPNSNYIIEYKNGCNTHPHNIYFEFLAEIGIVGFLLFFLLFCFLLKKLLFNFYEIVIKKSQNNLILGRFFILIGICTSMFPMIPSGSYFNNWMLIITYLPIGFYLSTFKSKTDYFFTSRCF